MGSNKDKICNGIIDSSGFSSSGGFANFKIPFENIQFYKKSSERIGVFYLFHRKMN